MSDAGGQDSTSATGDAAGGGTADSSGDVAGAGPDAAPTGDAVAEPLTDSGLPSDDAAGPDVSEDALEQDVPGPDALEQDVPGPPQDTMTADASSDVPDDVSSPEPDVCAPECAGKECGDDGCGGLCGTCPGAAPLCVDGACALPPACGDATCSPGEDCGSCPADCGVCPSEGACINASDLAIVEAVDVAGVASTAGTQCLFAADPGTCALEKILDATGVSPGCAGCYVDEILCAINNCLAQCAPPNQDSEPCQQCVAADCSPQFEVCAGFAFSDPPQEAECGDGVCNGAETCGSCDSDCGECSEEGACVNDSDLAIVDAVDAAAVAWSAGSECLFAGDPGACALESIIDETGLSSGCAGCYADEILCVISSCLSQCAPPNEGTEQCQQCFEAECSPAFEACAGFAFSDPQAAQCGDGACNGAETCGSCVADCGECPGDGLYCFEVNGCVFGGCDSSLAPAEYQACLEVQVQACMGQTASAAESNAWVSWQQCLGGCPTNPQSAADQCFIEDCDSSFADCFQAARMAPASAPRSLRVSKHVTRPAPTRSACARATRSPPRAR